MQNTLPTIDTNRLLPYTIGFDDLFNRLFDLNYESSGHGYPPYNIVKLNDNHYQIEMALAGFNKNDIEVNFLDGELVIKSKKDKNENSSNSELILIHQGISSRGFERRFTLSDEVQVNEAELKDGMLRIQLKKIIPEHKKPKLIKIN